MSRLNAPIIVAVLMALCAVCLSISQEYLPEWPKEWKQYQWLVWPVVALLATISVGLAYRQAKIRSIAATTAEQDQRNRSRTLEKVRAFWVKGVLEQSLYNVARIELGLEEKPNAVEHSPWDLLVQRPDRVPRLLPSGTQIRAVFDELDKALLILGAPGAGKTTLLLELARDLLDRAEREAMHPIPAVFNLSPWAEKRPSLTDWLVDELKKRYDVHQKIGQTWVDTEQILPLLDGLDEVAKEHRAACVGAINTFRQQHGLVPLVICSRVADYEALTVRLRLPGAIVVQPLTRGQIDHYLEQAGEPLAGVRAALCGDPTLWELLETPLMLSIVALAYQGRSAVELSATGTLAERRAHLFAAYTDAMFKRRAKATPYTQQQTVRWLVWLAGAMARHNQSVFYLEWMQPDWLPTRAQQKVVNLGAAITSGLVVGLLFWLLLGLLFWLLFWLLFGLVGGLLTVYEEKIRPIETLRWSWSHARYGLGRWLVVVGGLGGGLLVGLFYGLRVGLRSALFYGLGVGLLFGLVPDEITTRTVPNEGIRRSARMALVFGLLFGLLFGLAGGLGLGLIAGLIFGLTQGGSACLQHLILRFLLWGNDFTPWHYVRFLDYAAERIFLRKVGGGYIFVHRLLLEYFETVQPQVDGRQIAKAG